MSELGGLLVLGLGLGALAATGALAACCLRLRSAAGFLLAAYVVAWIWAVALALALSPARWLTRGSLVAGLVAGLVVAVAVWLAAGRPSPPPVRPAFRRAATAFRDPAILVLAVAVGLGAIYVAGLALFTPANDWDALAYHLGRASLWRQQQGLGHIEDVADERVNFFPPNAEIGQLVTMLLASNDRYVVLPQLLAYGALVVCVAGLARRIGLGVRESVFAALAFAALPVPLLQASSALNDLVVASFLAAAASFALAAGRGALVLLAGALALAVGAKYTTLIALPALALVAAVAQPPRRWPALVLAGLAGGLAGSVWYAVNLVETGSVDADIPGQRADVSPVPLVIMGLRFLVSFVEMPGADWPHAAAFIVAAGALALAAAWRRELSLLLAAALTAAVVAVPLLWDLVVRVPFKAALVLGREDVVDRASWAFNTRSEPGLVWYGPLGLLLLVAGTLAALVAWRRREAPALAAVLALAPLVMLATLTLLLSWDWGRGRFLLAGIALAAASWGLLVRIRALAYATAAIGATAVFLLLANHEGKPSGLFAGTPVWNMSRWQAQTTLNGLEADVLAYVEENVPDDAPVALSFVEHHWIHPYFGPELSRRVVLVPGDGGSPPADVDWLVVGKRSKPEYCRESWEQEHTNRFGWRIERRLAPDRCLAGGS